MKRIGLLTSGGDAPGMNAAVRAAVRGAIYNDMQIYGIYKGYEGLMNGDIEELGLSSVSDIVHRGGTMLLTARSRRFMTEEGFRDALGNVGEFGIEGLIVIGGDGSFKGADKLFKSGVPTVCIPGTIDNDLGYTDFTIGFDTAVNTVVALVSNIRDTSISHGCATIVEVMGRDCGDIALYAGLASGAESILIPEDETDIDGICEKILSGKSRGKLHSLIMMAEGVKISSYELSNILKERTGIDTRTVVPGYIQRGGSPSATDRILASRLGYRAVELLRDNVCGRAVGISDNRIVDVPIDEAIAAENRHPFEDRKLASILSI
ncbi:MAG: 6-phosphofructokinase [Anaerovoracaceae bacterium]